MSPPWFPINFYDLVGFSRVHIAPVVIASSQKYSLRTSETPDLSDLLLTPAAIPKWSPTHDRNSRSIRKLEQFLLDRIDENGTLLSYASCTYFMIFARLALGYPKEDPVIQRALEGIKSLAFETAKGLHIQNSSSTVWDTALLSYSLQEAGLSADERIVRKAGQYILSRQHAKQGDWQVHNPDAAPGGWGFSDINTLNPDIDDTTACLRAICQLAKVSATYQSAWDKGMAWLLSMQNQDGGWPAFEKNTNKKLLSMLSIDGAHSSLTDPSNSDLTGRYWSFWATLPVPRFPFSAACNGWRIRSARRTGRPYIPAALACQEGFIFTATAIDIYGLCLLFHIIKRNTEPTFKSCPSFWKSSVRKWYDKGQKPFINRWQK